MDGMIIIVTRLEATVSSRDRHCVTVQCMAAKAYCSYQV